MLGGPGRLGASQGWLCYYRRVDKQSLVQRAHATLVKLSGTADPDMVETVRTANRPNFPAK
jgi:hypothetical protein